MADTASLIARVKTEGVAAADKQLDDFAASAAKAETQTEKFTAGAGKANIATRQAANDGFAKFRNAAGQVGFQVQDMVVQLQSGTSAFVAIGQQGSQLAGAFGHGGAVLGAVIALASAVGGVLYKSLGNARASAEELKSAQDALQKVLDKTSSGAYEASDALAQLVLSGGSVAEQQALIASASQGLQTQMKDATLAVKDATEATSSWMYGNAIGANSALNLGQSTSALSGFIENLSDKFGITSDEATKLTPLLAAVQKNSTPENVKALADATANLVAEHGDQNSALVLLNGTLQNYITLTRNSEAASKALKVAQENATKRINEQNDAIIQSVKISNLADKERYKAQAEADKEAFAKRVGVTKEQIAEYNAARDEEARQDIKRVEETEAKRNAAQEKSLMAEQKRIENEAARQQKAADTFLDTLARQNQNELEAIDAQERQKLKTLEKFHEEGLIKGQEYEDAKTQITLDADTKRNELLQKQTEERMKEQESADAYIAQLQANFEGEAAELDRQYAIKQQKLDEFHKKGLVSEEDYQNAKAELQEQKNQESLEMDLQTWGQIAGNIASASKEGTALYKAAAITQSIISTYTAATKALAEGGPILGPILAATTVALGMANVAKIRSAREQGGNLSVGQVSTIAERNKPEVIMPASASRVRTAEQMRQIMGENGGKSSPTSINIVNQTTGRIDSVQQQQDDEGRITLLIREVVSGDLQDSNSKISQSRRVTRNQPGFA